MQTIFIRLKPSYQYAICLTLIGILSAVSMCFAPIGIIAKIIWGLLLIFATTFYVLRDALLRLPSSWKVIEIDSQGKLTLTNLQDTHVKATVSTNSYVATHLIVLLSKITEEIIDEENSIKPSKLLTLYQRYFILKPSIVLLSDSASADELRKLRVWLLWWRHGVNQLNDAL